MAAPRSGIKTVQDGWRILVIFVSGFSLLALVWSLVSVPMYRAEATFLVYPNANLTSSRDVVSSLDTLEGKSVSTTYADILDSRRVRDDTIAQLQLDETSTSRVNIYAEPQKDSNILILYVEGPDPKLNTLLANNIGQYGISFIKSIYQVFDISFLDIAVEPQKPYQPRPLLYLLIAAAAGLLFGLLFLLLRESLRIPLEALKERALTDKQSLAYNRKHMIRTLSRELMKPGTEPLPFGLIHLQGLEDLYDNLPEKVTTATLQTVVNRLHAMLRGNDLVARWDKLNFSVLLPSTPEMPAVKTFERLLQALEEPVVMDSGDQLPLLPVAGLVIRRADDTIDTMMVRGEEATKAASSGAEQLVISR